MFAYLLYTCLLSILTYTLMHHMHEEMEQQVCRRFPCKTSLDFSLDLKRPV